MTTPSNYLLDTLRVIRESGRVALCGYLLAGYPTPDVFFQMARAASELDIIEFGIPADEPRLDGPVIASAHQIVTEQHGIHAEPALALIGGLRDLPQPRFVMTYADVGRALDGFLRLCIENNVHGVLAPDADLMEGAFIAQKAHDLGLAVITFLDARAPEDVAERSIEIGDLIYLKASTGATGQSAEIQGELRDTLAAAVGRIHTLKPSALTGVGIGVQRPDQVADLAALGVDMVIVGTRLVEHLGQGEQSLIDYIRSLRAATYLSQDRSPSP